MDPLSVTASITGLLAAGAQVVILLQRVIHAPSIPQTVGVNIQHFIGVLSQLHLFVMGETSADPSRTSMIVVQQTQIVVTGYVLTFCELHVAVDRLGQLAGKMGIRDRVKWALAEPSIRDLLQRL